MANIAKVTMPQLGESVTEGTIGAWLKQPGDKVEKYESLAEVITDKVNAEIPSPYTGTIKELLVPENEPVPNGTLICTIETEADVSDAPAPPAVAPPPPPAPPLKGEGSAPVPVAAAPAPAPAAVAVAAPPAPVPAQTGGNGASAGAGAKRLSPAVARLLEEHDLDLNQIPGTGLEGRVTKLDVDRYLEMRAAGTLPAPAPAQPAAPAPVAATPAPAQPATVPGSAHADIGMRSPYEPTESMPVPAAPAPAPAPAASAPAAQPPALPSVFEGSGDQVLPWTQMRSAIAKHMV